MRMHSRKPAERHILQLDRLSLYCTKISAQFFGLCTIKIKSPLKLRKTRLHKLKSDPASKKSAIANLIQCQTNHNTAAAINNNKLMSSYQTDEIENLKASPSSLQKLIRHAERLRITTVTGNANLKR